MPTTQSPKREVRTITLWPQARACLVWIEREGGFWLVDGVEVSVMVFHQQLSISAHPLISHPCGTFTCVLYLVVLNVVSTLLSLKPQTTQHMMAEWCMTTMALSICNETPPALDKGMGNTNPWTTRRWTKRQLSEECSASSFPKHPFTLINHCLGYLFTHSQPPISLLSVVIPWMKKPT